MVFLLNSLNCFLLLDDIIHVQIRYILIQKIPHGMLLLYYVKILKHFSFHKKKSNQKFALYSSHREYTKTAICTQFVLFTVFFN